jgi:hypothetical protein
LRFAGRDDPEPAIDPAREIDRASNGTLDNRGCRVGHGYDMTAPGKARGEGRSGGLKRASRSVANPVILLEKSCQSGNRMRAAAQGVE